MAVSGSRPGALRQQEAVGAVAGAPGGPSTRCFLCRRCAASAASRAASHSLPRRPALAAAMRLFIAVKRFVRSASAACLLRFAVQCGRRPLSSACSARK